MKDIMELMKERHSVRSFLDDPIPEDVRMKLNGYCEELNEEDGLHMQIIYDEPDCFDTFLTHYGLFEGCSSYISICGKKAGDLEERSGYYGEKLVLKAQELGLNTCWTALTHGKSKAVLSEGETEVIIIALGYGKSQGKPHKSKSLSDVSNITDSSPEWFKTGVEAALLAPTAVNQQKFYFTLEGNRVKARHGLIGSCLKIDLGIVKCHFELAAGKENFEWA